MTSVPQRYIANFDIVPRMDLTVLPFSVGVMLCLVIFFPTSKIVFAALDAATFLIYLLFAMFFINIGIFFAPNVAGKHIREKLEEDI